MDEHDIAGFLSLQPQGNGELIVHALDGQTFTFAGLDLDLIFKVCPLLAFSFEERSNGRKIHVLTASSIELVSRFLRFLYTGEYHVLDHTGQELPCSLLLHAQLYHYGELYDVPLLVNTAYLHISQACEIACSMPSPPADLCNTLKYLYKNVNSCFEVHHTILHYCITCFSHHHLGDSPDFRNLLLELPECEQDLCKLNMQRGFEDETSADIIRMQLPRTEQRQCRSYDYIYDIFGSSNASTPMQTPLMTPEMRSPPFGFTLVHQPRHPGSLSATEDSDGYYSDGSLSSDFEGFSLVDRSQEPRRSGCGRFRGHSTHPPFPAADEGMDSNQRGLQSRSENDTFDEDDRVACRSRTPSGDDKRIRLSRDANGSSPIPSCITENHVLRPAATHSIQVPELAESLAPLDGIQGAEKASNGPISDPSDAEYSESEWSVLSDRASPHKTAGSPERSLSFCGRFGISGSTETIVSASDLEPSTSSHAELDGVVKSLDSERAVVSDGESE
ncbi:uncharacterized protein PV09_01274 [Verruconis gallopava]|uniref:BTB domain-containing protein n=1 Tax=Verruconis gallopava TaxID=253628 RepID=A0A0D2ANS3_9PEZI|nr:uncharacterized protein PV09_01274 [Verruconis gallopava]KIW08358.1 hypothetical protein PV09_01274 [Verruconis gallopava]